MSTKGSTHVPKQKKKKNRQEGNNKPHRLRVILRETYFSCLTEYTSAKKQSTDLPDFWKHSKESNYGR